MNWRVFPPNIITLGNLFCGVSAIALSFQSELLLASYLMVAAAILDFLDGLVARLIKGTSPIGVQLDSLADMVTFGVLPGVMMFQYLSICYGDYYTPIMERNVMHLWVEGIAFLIPALSAVRLAKFNISDDQGDHFVGLPTPATALLIATVPWVLEGVLKINMYASITNESMHLLKMANPFWSNYKLFWLFALSEKATYILASIILSGLLVAPFKMINMKFKSLSWEPNKERFVFLILVGGLGLLALIQLFTRIPGIPFLGVTIIPIVLLLYIVYSLLLNLKKDNKNEI